MVLRPGTLLPPILRPGIGYAVHTRTFISLLALSVTLLALAIAFLPLAVALLALAIALFALGVAMTLTLRAMWPEGLRPPAAAAAPLSACLLYTSPSPRDRG